MAKKKAGRIGTRPPQTTTQESVYIDQISTLQERITSLEAEKTHIASLYQGEKDRRVAASADLSKSRREVNTLNTQVGEQKMLLNEAEVVQQLYEVSSRDILLAVLRGSVAGAMAQQNPLAPKDFSGVAKRALSVTEAVLKTVKDSDLIDILDWTGEARKGP